MHALAARHLGGAARWQLAGARGRDGAGAGADAEAAAAAAWAALPVLKSRPDVLLADGWRAQEGLPRMHKAFTKAAAAAAKRLAGAAAREGPPGGGGGGGGEEEEAAEGEGGAPGGRVLGHKGPWPGGWGDIAWAMPLGTFDKVLGKVGFGRLAPLLRDEAVGGFGGCGRRLALQPAQLLGPHQAHPHKPLRPLRARIAQLPSSSLCACAASPQSARSPPPLRLQLSRPRRRQGEPPLPRRAGLARDPHQIGRLLFLERLVCGPCQGAAADRAGRAAGHR